MMISLSDRLMACCSFISAGERVADIGCDHGYLGIYLLSNGLASGIIAADVHDGPLKSAVANAVKYGVQDRISFYLSDGVKNIPRDFDTLVCAGMGADTMMHILEEASWLKSSKYRLILQCQSKRPTLRKFLYDNGWRISRETLARDGKFIYPVMEVLYDPAPPLSPAQCHISPALRSCGSPLHPEFYDRVIDGLQQTVQGLLRSGEPERCQAFQQIINVLQEERP